MLDKSVRKTIFGDIIVNNKYKTGWNGRNHNLVSFLKLGIHCCFCRFCLFLVSSADPRSVWISERHLSVCICWCQAASDIHRRKTPSKEIRQTSSGKCWCLFWAVVILVKGRLEVLYPRDARKIDKNVPSIGSSLWFPFGITRVRRAYIHLDFAST